MTCDNCNQRETCKTLCQDVEYELSKIEKPLAEYLPKRPLAYGNPIPWASGYSLTPTEEQVATLLQTHTRKQICNILSIEKKTLRNYIYNIKKKYHE